MQEGFLYRFFHQLRKQLHIELGIGEYFLLLEAIELGYDPVDTQVMYDLCRRLWLKDLDHQEAYHQLFTQLAEEEIRKARLAIETAKAKQKETETDSQTKTDKNERDRTSKADQKERAERTKKAMADKAEQVEKDFGQPVYTAQEVSIQLPEDTGEDLDMATLFQKKYLMRTNYQPLTLREMKQGWRFLRNKVVSGYSNDLDIEKTVIDAARTGLMEDLHFLPDYKNKLQQFLFIDISKSMVAFDGLGHQLEQAARDAGPSGTHIFYFEGTLEPPFYRTRERTRAISMEELYQLFPPLYANVILFSDAAAAIGKMDGQRLSAGWYFLLQLKKRVQHLVWLNPMPQNRWAGTAAETLANVVPMYPCDRQGYAEAIKVLRGKNKIVNGR
jgi:uncharacterized protein with von Willebrand factor type A (vWA) domain